MFNNQSLQAVQNQLALFAAQGNFDAIMTTAFGSRLDRAKLQLLRQQWLSGNFSVIPDIQILSQGELGTANGAYAASLDKIFISSDFLAYASESQVTTLILEEVGHRIDQLLNGGADSAGDEGEWGKPFCKYSGGFEGGGRSGCYYGGGCGCCDREADLPWRKW
jgi:hypothetical protein